MSRHKREARPSWLLWIGALVLLSVCQGVRLELRVNGGTTDAGWDLVTSTSGRSALEGMHVHNVPPEPAQPDFTGLASHTQLLSRLCQPGFPGSDDPIVRDGAVARRMLYGIDAGIVRGRWPKLVRESGPIVMNGIHIGTAAPIYCCEPPDGDLRCVFFRP